MRVLGIVLALAATAGVAFAEAGEAPASEGELHQRVPTQTPRKKLSEFLVPLAKKAEKKKDWAAAIPIYQALVAARGPASPEARQLAVIWQQAGQIEQATLAWIAYSEATTGAQHDAAMVEIGKLALQKDPLADKLLLKGLVAEAKQAFAAGRAAFAKKHYGDALVHFHIGAALAPDLPGFLRELGATYDKLGAAVQRRELYRRYLVARPFGRNADLIRAELAKEKDVLGSLLISSSFPCTEMWINRQRIEGKLPEKGLVVAPGSYKGLCFNPKYEMALFEYATVEAGKPAVMSFAWAIVENKLERPLGRIALENPKAPGVMIDLGITATEVGVAAPSDGRKLKMVLKDDSGMRSEERRVEIRPGQRVTIKW
jgi:tetratricopeptide (TPR) repeat protein